MSGESKRHDATRNCDELAVLQEENEHLKASRDRLRRFHFAVFAAMDGRIGQELGEVSTQELDELERVADEAEAALLPGDLADADPATTLPVLGEECRERLDSPLEWEGE